eukprot:3934405-Rhodomonas_salina.5
MSKHRPFKCFQSGLRTRSICTSLCSRSQSASVLPAGSSSRQISCSRNAPSNASSKRGEVVERNGHGEARGHSAEAHTRRVQRPGKALAYPQRLRVCSFQNGAQGIGLPGGADGQLHHSALESGHLPTQKLQHACRA